MPLFNPFAEIQKPLSRVNLVVARAIVISIATVLVVAGLSILMRHLLNPATIAKVRLEREGYKVEAAAAFEAVKREDPMALLRLQTAGVSLLSLNDQGRTPYEEALRTDRLALLETLAGLGAVPKLEPAVLDKNLVQALERGARETAEMLLTRGANPNLQIEPNLPLLVWAITTNREQAVELLIRHKADIEAASKLGTPLLVAYSKGDFPLFDRFVTLGANPNQSDLSGRSLGVATILDNRVDYARRLLAAKADPNVKGKDGVSMLDVAFQKRMEPLFVELVQAGGRLSTLDAQQRTYLERAAEERDYHWMELLLAQGVDPNQRTANGNDPLWWNRYRQGDPSGAELLLARGANINAPTATGVLPIDHAIEGDEFRVVRYLFSQGAETTGKLWQPLQQRKHLLLRLVLANEAGGGSPAVPGMTALGYAIRNGDLTGAALLMEYGARYAKTDRPDGHSLLEWAIAHRQLPIVEALAKQGANVNEYVSRPAHPAFLALFKANGNLVYHLKGDSNVTPLMVVAGSHQLDLARVLLDRGAKRHVWTKRNRTDPVTFAIRADNLPMAQLMLGREPELNGNHLRKVVVSRSDQRARFYKNGELVYSTRCSTGKSGYRTPGGTFVITDKTRLRYSSLYGSAMPFFHRLSGSAIGMHEGYVPGYPASHGCIRLPYQYAKIFYEHTELGDIVVVE